MVAGVIAETHVENFNQHRPLLYGIAWRMLGNPADAEDLLQEALLRWIRTSPLEIRSPRAFLVTMVTRLCLNHLDLARVKKEISFDLAASRDWLAATEANPANDEDLAEALDVAFSVVLKCLSPIERAVFLLREVFECDYSEVARIVEKSEDNCRQILSRARERIAGRDPRFEVSVEQQETVLREFLSATATGDLDRLAKALAGDATLICDGENLGAVVPPPLHGAAAVSDFLIDRIRKLLSAGVHFRQSHFGQVPLLLAYGGGKLVKAFALVLRAGHIRAVYVVNCPVRLRSIAAQCRATEQGENPKS
jgi:RNA polymerase sigma-70 factor (ECF subfamily)